MILSILIPTVIGREVKLAKLLENINFQIYDLDCSDVVNVRWFSDNKQMSIGDKRDKMYKESIGDYSWQIDDDDEIHHNAISLILKSLEKNPDCVGFKELCIFDGKRVESSCFSLRYPQWGENIDGYNHVRTPFTKSVIRTDLCRKVGVKDLRWGEDHQFAKDIYPLLKKEQFIDEFIYHYIYSSKESHNDKYGIK